MFSHPQEISEIKKVGIANCCLWRSTNQQVGGDDNAEIPSLNCMKLVTYKFIQIISHFTLVFCTWGYHGRISKHKGIIPKFLGGMGNMMLWTTQGVMVDWEAQEKKIWGEILCHVIRCNFNISVCVWLSVGGRPGEPGSRMYSVHNVIPNVLGVIGYVIPSLNIWRNYDRSRSTRKENRGRAFMLSYTFLSY